CGRHHRHGHLLNRPLRTSRLPGPVVRTTISRFCGRTPAPDPPTTGVTVEYTPDATARPGVSSAAGPKGPAAADSEAEAPGRPNPGIHRPPRAGRSPPSFPAAGFHARSFCNAPDHHAPDA